MEDVTIKFVKENKAFSGVLITLIILVGIVILLAPIMIYIIEDGQVGVKKTFGHISDEEIGTGVAIIIPFVESIEVYDVKTQEIGESSSVPSSEGLIITLDASVLYHLEPTMVAELRKNVNANFKDTLIVPYIRNEFRDTISGYEAKTIYSQSGRKEISNKIKDNLIQKLQSRGIIIEDILLRGITLPQKLTDAIELKLQKEQEAQRKEFELLAATKDAEIEVERAKGVAEANKIIADSIDKDYILYLWVQGLQNETSEVIYVPTEANLPILEATRLTE
ncbi:MAG: prohibitin family protein [Candidatus Diapherotrites archaeon]|nr:prohibitin family protein [Candidatus Diapherotrites archaeon]